MPLYGDDDDMPDDSSPIDVSLFGADGDEGRRYDEAQAAFNLWLSQQGLVSDPHNWHRFLREHPEFR